jgi:hypothetical protein
VSLLSWAKCTARARRVGLGNQLELSLGVGMVFCPISDMRPLLFLRASSSLKMGSSTQKKTISSLLLYFLHTSHFKSHRLLPRETALCD